MNGKVELHYVTGFETFVNFSRITIDDAFARTHLVKGVIDSEVNIFLTVGVEELDCVVEAAILGPREGISRRQIILIVSDVSNLSIVKVVQCWAPRVNIWCLQTNFGEDGIVLTDLLLGEAQENDRALLRNADDHQDGENHDED